MQIVIILIAFIIPIATKDFFNYVQAAMAAIWLIVIIAIPSVYPPSNFELVTERIIFLTLPAWVFGSLLALSLKSRKVSDDEVTFHENYFHHSDQNK